MLEINDRNCLVIYTQKKLIPYGGKLWRVQTLANWQGKLHWRNKLWRIDYESLIKRMLKQFEDTSAPNLSIRARVCARMAVSSSVESMIRGYHEYKLIWNNPVLQERNWSAKGSRDL